MGERFTFAVVGHDEAPTLAYALGRAVDAAEDGDRVWFVDSESTDGSASIAADLGAEVVPAPLGKGRAMQAAFDRCGDGYLCFLDADYEWSEQNIPALVRAAAVDTDADMVVGAYSEPARRLVSTPAVYRPLATALLPEVLANIDVALSGFRAVRRDFVRRPLPPRFGAETFLNIELNMAGARVRSCPVGEFKGKLRSYANTPLIAADLAEAILDAAVRHGRLAAEARPAWEAWVEVVRDVITSQPPPGADDEEFLARLASAAARPLPGTGVGGDR